MAPTSREQCTSSDRPRHERYLGTLQAAGIRRLPEGKRRSMLNERIDAALEPYRSTRSILPFDDVAAEQYADVLARREQAGLPSHTADAQIAAICRAHGATC